MAEENKKVEEVVENKDKELTDLRNLSTQLVNQYKQLEGAYKRLSTLCDWLFSQYISGGNNDANKQ